MSRYITALLLFVVCELALGCSGNEPGEGAITPDPAHPDPEETTTVSIYKNTGQSIEGIYVDVNDKLTSDNGWMFADMGKLKGLGEVTFIPVGGWQRRVAARKGEGYVAFNPRHPSGFMRLFVSNMATDEMGTVTGFQIKYQRPFLGSDEAAAFDCTDFNVSADGDRCVAYVTNRTVIPFTVETDCDWIVPERFILENSVSSEYRLDMAIEIVARQSDSMEPTSGTITVTTGYGKETVIHVTRDAMAPMAATTSILDLKKKYWSGDAGSATYISGSTVIRGRVVSTDEFGNIYKSLVIDDGTAAIPLSINAYDLYRRFPLGQELAIDVCGLYIGNHGAYQQIGTKGYSNDGLPMIQYMPDVPEVCQCIGRPEPDAVVPVSATIGELLEARANAAELARWQGRYVAIDNVAFEEQDVPLAVDGYTERMIYDALQQSLIVRTSPYATFATAHTPVGVGSVTGILTYYNGTWKLMLNSLDDIGPFDPSQTIARPEPDPSPDAPCGDGSEASPYNVASVLALGSPGTISWVEGYIVGSVNGTTIDQSAFDGPFEQRTNVLIADGDSEKDYSRCVPVQLPVGAARTNLNLVDNPANLGRKIRVLGYLQRYYGLPGVKGVSSFGL